MAGARKQKRRATGRGPLLALFVLFADSAAAAELFRMVRWYGGVFCPDCKHENVVKYCLYQKNLQRYTCKDCCKTFNDKTGSLLHYKHVSIGNWMLALWLFLCGPLNGASIRFISQATGQAYKTAYYMMRGIMAHIRNLPEKPLKGTCETDEAYVKAGSTYVFVARVWPGYLAFCYPPIATYVFVARVWPGYLAFCYPPIAIP